MKNSQKWAYEIEEKLNILYAIRQKRRKRILRGTAIAASFCVVLSCVLFLGEDSLFHGEPAAPRNPAPTSISTPSPTDIPREQTPIITEKPEQVPPVSIPPVTSADKKLADNKSVRPKTTHEKTPSKENNSSKKKNRKPSKKKSSSEKPPTPAPISPNSTPPTTHTPQPETEPVETLAPVPPTLTPKNNTNLKQERGVFP